ncbi:MAG TPA: protein kinase [Pyrinomonadaceae bacterium]|nr:protein kinase [Pyrinomonadaceae bacterium]
MSFCHECGAKIAPDDPFCGNCGVAQPARSAAQTGEAAPSEAIAAAAAESSEAVDAEAGNGSAQSSSSAASEPDVTESPDGKDPAASAAASASYGNFDDTETPEVNSSLLDTTESPDLEPWPQASAGSDAGAAQGTQLEKTYAPDESAASASAQAAPARDTGEMRKSGDNISHTQRAGSTGGRKSGSKQLEPGFLLNGRYEIVRRIGGGGMGAVYLAKDQHLGDAPRAVKEMVESHIDDSQHEKAINDFRRESLLLTSLEHPSIPTIYDYFYDNKAARFYLVMKYISGGDFAGRLRNAPSGRIDEKTITDWAIQVADVLDYLHNHRPPIIYRDLKPANLMIDGNSGRVMLIDFGIARWVKQEEKGVTAVGTMGYAPPELFSGKVEPRSDIYSLGATMFHLLTGSDPQDNPLLIFDFTKNPRPRQINPAMSTEMERMLMRAVEYKPENRFRSAAEMRDTLISHLEKLRSGQVSYGAAPAAELGGETIQTEMVFCGFCGGRIAADDVYCAHCGQRQPLVGVGSAALRQARATAKLIVTGTTELDAQFQLQKENNLVGRSDPHSNIFPEVDLSRFDPETKVSRRHARIWRQGETFLIEDLNSVNGTVINDAVRLAPHQPRVLESGDKLRLGETTLHFLVG